MGSGCNAFSCNPGFMETLLAAKVIDQDVFAVCGNSEAPVLVVGGGDPRLYTGELVKTPMQEPFSYYTVGIEGMSVGGQAVAAGANAKGFVDTGTSGTLYVRGSFYTHTHDTRHTRLPLNQSNQSCAFVFASFTHTPAHTHTIVTPSPPRVTQPQNALPSLHTDPQRPPTLHLLPMTATRHPQASSSPSPPSTSSRPSCRPRSSAAPCLASARPRTGTPPPLPPSRHETWLAFVCVHSEKHPYSYPPTHTLLAHEHHTRHFLQGDCNGLTLFDAANEGYFLQLSDEQLAALPDMEFKVRCVSPPLIPPSLSVYTLSQRKREIRNREGEDTRACVRGTGGGMERGGVHKGVWCMHDTRSRGSTPTVLHQPTNMHTQLADGGPTVVIPSSQYLLKGKDAKGGGFYQMNVESAGDVDLGGIPGMVLGQPLLQQYYVEYDRANTMLGWAPAVADCAAAIQQEQEPAQP